MDAVAEIEPSAFLILTLAFSIGKAGRAIMGLKLAEIGLAAGQDQFLVCLDLVSQRSVGEISTYLQVRPSTVSKMTDGMVAHGLVERAITVTDARRSFVRLTPAGKIVQGEVMEVWSAIESDLRRRLGDASDAAIGTSALVDEALAGYLARIR